MTIAVGCFPGRPDRPGSSTCPRRAAGAAETSFDACLPDRVADGRVPGVLGDPAGGQCGVPVRLAGCPGQFG